MGRHSAPDDDDEASASAVAIDDDPVAARRGRHNRGEDLADTGPVPGTEMRTAEQRAAMQDERPTQRLALDELLTEEDPPPVEESAAATVEPAAEPTPEPAAKQAG